MEKQQYQFFTFSPALPCVRCERLTTFATVEYWNDEKDYTFEPVCFEHGFTCEEDYSLIEQNASIARFVVGMKGGKGEASVLRQHPTESIPGHEHRDIPKGNDPDRGWVVRYADEHGVCSLVWVVWQWDWWEFTLYEQTWK